MHQCCLRSAFMHKHPTHVQAVMVQGKWLIDVLTIVIMELFIAPCVTIVEVLKTRVPHAMEVALCHPLLISAVLIVMVVDIQEWNSSLLVRVEEENVLKQVVMVALLMWIVHDVVEEVI